VKATLSTLACLGMVRFKLDQLLDPVAFNEQQVVKTATEIRRFCRGFPVRATRMAAVGNLMSDQVLTLQPSRFCIAQKISIKA
jgi:hypothetical protein